jgi:hypothetical protein
MNTPSQEVGVAAYLLGHGPYRSPRPIDLQWMRIHRYRHLLGSKYGDAWSLMHDYIDINYPRANTKIDEQTFPSFFRLLGAVNEGLVGLVFLDIEEEIGTSHYYGWAARSLMESGAQVVNVFYDSENVLEAHLAARFQGQAYIGDVDDASDFVAFYPALSSRIALAALRSLHRHAEGCEKVTPKEIWNTLYDLKDLNPYAANREPFIQEELVSEWAEQVRAIELQGQVDRRKHEQLFRLSPCMVGLLVDEFPSSKLEARSSEELIWAEARVTSELSFKEIIEGQTIAYIREIEGYLVFADIRIKETITFYLYRLPNEAKAKERSSKSFSLRDRLSRELEAKWNALFQRTI